MSSSSVSFGMMLISCAKSGEVSSSSENAAAWQKRSNCLYPGARSNVATLSFLPRGTVFFEWLLCHESVTFS